MKPGPPPKSPERRQRRNIKPQLRLVPPPVDERPPPERGWLKATKLSWAAFWGDELAGLVKTSADLEALTRLFSWYDESRRAWRLLRGTRLQRVEVESPEGTTVRMQRVSNRLVEGSMGQPVLSPLYSLVRAGADVIQLEDRFGLNPAARLKLGIDLGKARKSLEEMNRDLADEGDDADQDETDPRLAAVQLADHNRRRKAAPEPG